MYDERRIGVEDIVEVGRCVIDVSRVWCVKEMNVGGMRDVNG